MESVADTAAGTRSETTLFKATPPLPPLPPPSAPCALTRIPPRQAKGKKGAGKGKSNGVAPGHGADANVSANGKAADTGAGHGGGGKEERRKQLAALETKVGGGRLRIRSEHMEHVRARFCPPGMDSARLLSLDLSWQ